MACQQDTALQGFNQHIETDFTEREQKDKKRSAQDRAVRGSPTSIPTCLLSDDRRGQRDGHLHLWFSAGGQNDGGFLDRTLHLIFLWCYNLEGMVKGVNVVHKICWEKYLLCGVMLRKDSTVSCLGRCSTMRVRRLLVGFSEQSSTRFTFLSPRSSKPLARTPTLITPFRALRQPQEKEEKTRENVIKLKINVSVCRFCIHVKKTERFYAATLKEE